MDVVLDILDEYILDNLYAKVLPADTKPNFPLLPPINLVLSTWHSLISVLPVFSSLEPSNLTVSNTPHQILTQTTSIWPRDNIYRQILSLSVITIIGIHVLYFLFAGLSYRYIFNHDMMRHSRFLPHQVRKEILTSIKSFPGMTVLTLPFFLSEVRGYTRLYDNIDDYGWAYLLLSVPLFLLFTDYCIYWIHRWLHIPFLYKRIHKPHHKWIVPTPFASHAFHPVDGWAQSLPYHFFIFIFPMQHHLYLVMFVIVNCWSIFIHDSDMITGHPLEHAINGPAHHTLHHLYFTCNYGQYFTWADRTGGSYRHPDSRLDPLLDVKARDKLNAEEVRLLDMEKEKQGDALAEEWENQILGSGKAKIE